MKLLAIWMLTCLIWSSVWLFIKLGLADLPPFSFAGLRLLIAVIVLLPVIGLRRIPLLKSSRDFALIAASGLLLLGLNYGLVFWGAQFIPSGLTALLQSATPAFGLMFAMYFLPQEGITLRKVGATLIGIAGVAIIASDQLNASENPSLLGCLAVTGGAICVAFSYVIVKAKGSHLHPLALIAGQMICGMIPLLAIGLQREGNPLDFRWSGTGIFSLFYLAIAGSIAAFGLNYWLLKRMEAAKVMLMSIVQPLFAALLGWFILGETLAGQTIWGGICILLSIVLVFSAQSKTPPKEIAERGAAYSSGTREIRDQDNF